MKKILLMTALPLMIWTSAHAQKFAYVNTDYIMESIPEYAEAQKQLDAVSVRWQKEIEEKYAEIDALYKSYQAEQILLTEEMKKKREDEIIQKEKEVKDMQKAKFGVNGELFKKRQELVKPIQDKIYTAIKDIAERDGYAIIFDKANNTGILFTDEKYDKSDVVLKKLGYDAGSN